MTTYKLKTKKGEKDYGLMLIAVLYMILYAAESNPIIRASVVLAIAFLFSVITCLNWWVKIALYSK